MLHVNKNGFVLCMTVLDVNFFPTLSAFFYCKVQSHSFMLLFFDEYNFSTMSFILQLCTLLKSRVELSYFLEKLWSMQTSVHQNIHGEPTYIYLFVSLIKIHLMNFYFLLFEMSEFS